MNNAVDVFDEFGETEAGNMSCPCEKGSALNSGQAKEFLGVPDQTLKEIFGEPFLSYEYRRASMSVYNCHHTVVSVKSKNGITTQVESYSEQRRYPRVKPPIPFSASVVYNEAGQGLSGKVLDISEVSLAIECFIADYPEPGMTVLVNVAGIGDLTGKIYRVDQESGRVVILFQDEHSGNMQAFRSFVAKCLAG